MTRDEKKVIIDGLTEKFKETPFFYITDASGFSVAQTNSFRRACYDKGVEYRVYKNTDVFIGEANLEMLSKLKSKQELLGDLIGLLQSPAMNLISALQSGQNNLTGVLKTLAEREEK
jgi:ribosomal protein L10